MKKNQSIQKVHLIFFSTGFYFSFLFLFIFPAGEIQAKSYFQNVNKAKDVYVMVTTHDRSMDFQRVDVDFLKGTNTSSDIMYIDPAINYQSMDGFGAALTGSSAFNLLKMRKEDREKFLMETFDPETGLGFSYIRISIGCSDFSLSEYTCCDTPGVENFSLQKEEIDYVIPVLKEIIKINPTVKIMGSPWTCPRWMKVNNLMDKQPFNSWTDGQLNPVYYQDYAVYFVKWIQAFEAEGIPITSITIQNEPLNRKNSASLYMSWEEQRDFIKCALGPKMKAAGLKTLIYVFDHNYNYDNISSQKNYPVNIYDDPEANQYVTGAAYHDYGGKRSELNNIHNSYPDKELIFTETSIGTWNKGRDFETRFLSDVENVGLGTINNWCRGVIVWNLMLDTDRGPNREGGCKTCYGAVDIDVNDFKTITKNSHYYLLGHLSAVVKPGAIRVGTTGYSNIDMVASAFKNPDGTLALVLLNKSGENKKITVSDEENSFVCEIPKKSVASCQWNR